MDNALERRIIPELTEEGNKEAESLIDSLLPFHESLLSEFPSDGRNYFDFPQVSAELAESHDSLTDKQIETLVTNWVHSDLRNKSLRKYSPRALGSWLTTFSTENAFRIQNALESILILQEDPELIPKLTRFSELNTVLRMFPGEKGPQDNEHKVIRNTREHIREMISSRRDSFELDHAASMRASISLFGSGIRTENFTQIFNHYLTPVVINEFNEEQIPALEAALECPSYIEPLSAEHATRFQISLALTGAQVRSGQTDNLALMEHAQPTAGYEYSARTYLHYFFASEPQENIANQELRNLLEVPLHPAVIPIMLDDLVTSRKRIHPDSYLSLQLENMDCSPSTILKLIKTGLDVNDGNYDAIDPVIKKLCEQFREGLVGVDTAGELVLTCTAFGIPLPRAVEPYLVKENEYAFTKISSRIRRSSYDLGQLVNYPENAIYRIMSQGFEALPSQVRTLFQNQDNQRQTDALVKEVLGRLYNEGYFRHYFGAMIPTENYPDPLIKPKDVYKEFWKIVHPDIWGLIAKAKPAVILEFVQTKLKDGKVYVEMTHENGMRGSRETPFWECIPPEIYKKVTELPVDKMSLASRLKITTQKNPDQKKVATEYRIDTTDYVRNVLLPKIEKSKLPVDVLTQIRLIHKTHMKGKEHIVLHPDQAQRLLNSHQLETLDRLGGVMRSIDRLSINISLGGGLVKCASYERTPELMEQLSEAAEELFPKGDINPAIHKKNIYKALSAFQLAIALIHPFYEVNGRTSEDSMHILWNRRPDLQDTVRHISYKGDREGKAVERRMNIINDIALDIQRDIAKRLGKVGTRAEEINNYAGLVNLLKSKYKGDEKAIEKDYLEEFDNMMSYRIKRFRNLDFGINSEITRLGVHLRECSKTYKPRNNS